MAGMDIDGVVRYQRWFEKYPLTDQVILEMVVGQYECHAMAVFDLSAPLWVLDLEDKVTERIELFARHLQRDAPSTSHGHDHGQR